MQDVHASHLSASHLSILAIDNHPEVLAQISNIVKVAGHECRCACDMDSAAEAVRQSTPDLIISDVNLSGHSGMEVCDELRRQFSLGEMPVMFLSAAQGPDIIRRAHAHGGTYHLRKPFDAPVLVELIEKSRLLPHLTGF